MKTITNLVTSLILAAWIVAIAILSIQNVTLISLKFIMLESIQLPFGIVLAFSVGIGVLLGAILPFVGQQSGGRRLQYDAEEEDF